MPCAVMWMFTFLPHRPPQIPMLTHKVMAFGGDSGSESISVFIKEAQELSLGPSTMGRYKEKSAACSFEEGPH